MMPGLEKIDKTSLNGDMVVLGDVVSSVYGALRKTNRLVKESLWRKSPSELIKCGETFFMYSCIDYTLTTGLFLRKLGISGEIIVNELVGNHGPKAHFGIETDKGFIDHVVGNSVIIGHGELPNFYEPLKGEKQTNRHRLNLDTVDNDDTVFDIVRKMRLRIPLLDEETVQKLADQFECDNTPAVWEEFVANAGGDIAQPALYLKS